MPASLQFFDMETSTTTPSWQAPIPVTLGSNWQPNDIRVFGNFYFTLFGHYTTGSQSGGQYTFGNIGYVPPGFTGFGPGPNGQTTLNQSLNGYNYTYAVFNIGYGVIAWRRLVSGDTDTFVQPTTVDVPIPGTMHCFATVLFTVRGVDPASTPTRGGMGFTQYTPLPSGTNPVAGDTSVKPIANSISVPGAGTLVLWASSGAEVSDPISGGTVVGWKFNAPSANSMGNPAGWTGLSATPASGNTYFETDSNPASILVAKSFSGSGSTGAITFPTGPINGVNFQGCYAFFKPAPDVTATAGNASTATTATAATFSSATTVLSRSGSASTKSSTSTAFNSALGYWISDPLLLTGQAVTGSIVRWNAISPAGSTVTVQTSINNGASWDTATNNQPVPRLKEGDTATQFVLAKITLTQTTASGAFPGPAIYPGSSLYPTGSKPKVTSFEMSVSVDASVDELAPIGQGMIDAVTTHSTAGTIGAGSSTNVAGSTAVIGRGGGQTGGGTAIKIHVNDLSYAIKRNVWQMPYTVPSGLLYTEAIKAMVIDRLPDQTAFNLSSTTRVTPLLVYGAQQGGDPWQDIMELAQAIGFEVFFDPTGTFVCRPVPDPRIGEPVWSFDEDAVKLVVEAERELSSEQTFNDIVVVGQSTSTANPFSAEAYDDNPNSPTYILGPYGRVAQRLTFSLITSQDQAQDTANAALFNSLGAADTVTLTVVPMPALEPGDIVKVVCANVNANGRYMINSMTTPLSPASPQRLTCFRQSTNP